MSKLMRFAESRWFLVVLGVLCIVVFMTVSSQTKQIKQLGIDIKGMEATVKEARATLVAVENGFDADKQVAVMNNRTSSAEAIGAKVIKVADTLAAYYKTSEPLPESEVENEALHEELSKAQKLNSAYTGAKAEDHIQTWKLNPEWKLTLESVAVYQNTVKIPVLFKMTMADGTLAGLVRGVYDSDRDVLQDITTHYTLDGLDDAVDVGGA